MAYAMIEPFGQDRADDGVRLLATLAYGANRGKDSKALGPSDFLKPWQPREQIDSEARMLALAAWFDARVEG